MTGTLSQAPIDTREKAFRPAIHHIYSASHHGSRGRLPPQFYNPVDRPGVTKSGIRVWITRSNTELASQCVVICTTCSTPPTCSSSRLLTAAESLRYQASRDIDKLKPPTAVIPKKAARALANLWFASLSLDLSTKGDCYRRTNSPMKLLVCLLSGVHPNIL